MSGIRVSVSAPSELGRLFPHYVSEAGILATKSKVRRPWLFGVNVDNLIIFDLDEQRVLGNFEVLMKKKLWVPDLLEELPLVAPPGDLLFAQETVTKKWFELPVRVRTDPDRAVVRIELGGHQPDSAVSLSSSCIALLLKHELVGFVIKGF